MILGKEPAVPRVPAITYYRVLSPTSPAPLPLLHCPQPHCPQPPRAPDSARRRLLTAMAPSLRLPTMTPPRQLPRFRSWRPGLHCRGPARSKAIGQRSRVRHFRLPTRAGRRGGPRGWAATALAEAARVAHRSLPNPSSRQSRGMVGRNAGSWAAGRVEGDANAVTGPAELVPGALLGGCRKPAGLGLLQADSVVTQS